MERKTLEDMGLEKDQINQIMADYGKAINGYKNQVDNLTAENTTLKKQSEDSLAKVKELQKQTKDNDALSKQVADLQSQLENSQKQAQSELLQVKKNNAINNALKDAGVFDNKAVMPFIDMDAVHYNDDGLTGLKDQITKLKADKSFLFKQEKPQQGVQATVGKISKPDDGKVPQIDVTKASYSELANLKAKNPEQFNQLMK